MKLQLPTGLENEMLTYLLDKAISSKFFDLLRTQQQLGYIVHMAASVTVLQPYLVAVVQTEFNLHYVRGCLEKFLEEHFAFLEEAMTDEEFETCKEGLLSELRVKPKNISEEAQRFSRIFMDRSFDFERREKCIRFVEASTLAMLRSYVRDHVRKAPRIYHAGQKGFWRRRTSPYLAEPRCLGRTASDDGTPTSKQFHLLLPRPSGTRSIVQSTWRHGYDTWHLYVPKILSSLIDLHGSEPIVKNFLVCHSLSGPVRPSQYGSVAAEMSNWLAVHAWI